jgi:hypothetical protein
MADGTKPAVELEVEARAINATDWQPPPGMVKKRCLRCRYLFAVRLDEAEVTATCPDCAPSQTRARSNNSARCAVVNSLRLLARP